MRKGEIGIGWGLWPFSHPFPHRDHPFPLFCCFAHFSVENQSAKLAINLAEQTNKIKTIENIYLGKMCLFVLISPFPFDYISQRHNSFHFLSFISSHLFLRISQKIWPKNVVIFLPKTKRTIPSGPFHN